MAVVGLSLMMCVMDHVVRNPVDSLLVERKEVILVVILFPSIVLLKFWVVAMEATNPVAS